MDYQKDKEILRNSRVLDDAAINISRSGQSSPVYSELVDLTTAVDRAAPLKRMFPFKSVYISDASDSNAYIYILIGTEGSEQKAIKLRKFDSIRLGKPTDKCFLYFPAQSAKNITLTWALDAEVSTGAFNVIQSSGLDGTSVISDAPVTVTNTAGIIVPADNDRKQTTIRNVGTVDIYIGDSTVVVSDDMVLHPDEIMTYKNTAALYGVVSSTSGKIVSLTEK